MEKYIKTSLEQKTIQDFSRPFDCHVDYIVDSRDFPLIPSPEALARTMMDIEKSNRVKFEVDLEAEEALLDLLTRLGYSEAVEIYSRIVLSSSKE